MHKNDSFKTTIEVEVEVEYDFIHEKRTRDHPGGTEIDYQVYFNGEQLLYLDGQTEEDIEDEIRDHVREGE